jgi:hypothetical protein
MAEGCDIGYRPPSECGISGFQIAESALRTQVPTATIVDAQIIR